MSDIGAITYKGGAAVTPSDTAADPNGPFDALECTGTAGLAKVTCIDGSTLTVYLALGQPKALAVTRVWVTGTAATNVVGYKGAAGSV
jgi:hypothetical protein